MSVIPVTSPPKGRRETVWPASPSRTVRPVDKKDLAPRIDQFDLDPPLVSLDEKRNIRQDMVDAVAESPPDPDLRGCHREGLLERQFGIRFILLPRMADDPAALRFVTVLTDLIQ